MQNPRFFADDNPLLIKYGIIINERPSIQRARSFVYYSNAIQYIAGATPTRSTGESDADYTRRLTEWLESYLNAGGIQENILFPDASHRIMREELTSDPFLTGATAMRGSNNVDVFYNDRFPPASTRNTNRQRTFENVPIAFLLFSVCSCLANDIDIRDKINVYLASGAPIPKFFDEKLKSARRSTCGNFYISPTVAGLFTTEIRTLLNLNNTIYDYDYLRSDMGLSAVFSFFARLSQYPQCYISFVQGKPVLPDSGFTTTETALTTEQASYSPSPTTRTERRVLAASPAPIVVPNTLVPQSVTPVHPDYVLRVLPKHSYGDRVNQVQAIDSYINGRTLFDTESTARPILVGQFSPTGEVNLNSFNVPGYMILRVSGQIHNSDDLKSHELTKPTSVVDELPVHNTTTNEGKKRSATRFNKSKDSRQQRRFTNGINNFVSVIVSLLKEKLISSTQFTNLMSGLTPVLKYS